MKIKILSKVKSLQINVIRNSLQQIQTMRNQIVIFVTFCSFDCQMLCGEGCNKLFSVWVGHHLFFCEYISIQLILSQKSFWLR